MQRKVLYIITKSNWGGAQRYVFDLANTLPREEPARPEGGYEVVVALGGTGGKGESTGKLFEQLKANNIRALFVESFMRDISIGKELGALRELTRIIKNEKPDAVHLNSSKAGGLGALAARMAGVKNIIFTVHGLPHDEDRNPLSRLAIYLSTWATFVLCTKVITISQDNFKRVSRMPGCRKKVVLIHNGVATPQFKNKDEARTLLAQKLHPLPQSNLWIGAVGELTWNKGFHELVRAAGALKRRGVDLEVCIVGEGSERIFLETMIEDEGLADRVHLAGFVDNASQYLKAFDIYALSSIKEGLPYVLIEAGQAGLPVVATNVGGVSDIVGDKVSGLLVKPKNHGDLADKLEQLIKDTPLREKLGQALKERVEKEFSLEKMVRETAALY